MRYFFYLLCLSIIFTPTTGFSENLVKNCFENSESEGAISFCLSMAYKDRNQVREIIENEMLEIAKTKDALANEEIEEKRQAAMRNDNNDPLSTKFDEIDSALNSKTLLNKYRYLSYLTKSKELFEKYREIECNRQKTISGASNFEAAFIEKICLYDMTNQRIDALQSSIR
tara:strand:+ start:915 stop:1427 length:513 start_codon:yes stop_codon:yes gene_type:complete